MRWLSLFLACQHLNSMTNLRESEDQSWFQGSSGTVTYFRVPWVYAYPRLKTTVLLVDQCASDWFIVHKLTRSPKLMMFLSLTFFREKSVAFSLIAIFTRGKILLAKLCKILLTATTVRRWNCECACHTPWEHGGSIAVGSRLLWPTVWQTVAQVLNTKSKRRWAAEVCGSGTYGGSLQHY
jgi:hypothetical protein